MHLLRELAIRIQLAQAEVACPPAEALPVAELIRMGGFAAVAGYAIIVATIYRFDRNRAEKQRDEDAKANRALFEKTVDASLKEIAAKAELTQVLQGVQKLVERLVERIVALEDEVARLREGREARTKRGDGG